MSIIYPLFGLNLPTSIITGCLCLLHRSLSAGDTTGFFERAQIALGPRVWSQARTATMPESFD